MIVDDTGATVFAPTLPRTTDPRRGPWTLPAGKKLAVSVLLHAPAYLDVVPPSAHKPLAMQGGVGRETGEPRHGQVARLSQWDFGLTVGLWRLLDIAADAGVPVAVALDVAGVRTKPGLAALVAERAGEVVARGQAADVVLHPDLTVEQETEYVRSSLDAVARATGRPVTGWFSPERATTPHTTAVLRAAGLDWFGDWPVDERPVTLVDDAAGLTAVPFSLETEDLFALYTRGLPFADYERVLLDTVDQLIEDAELLGARFLGLSWFGWVLGQACFADVAERVLHRLAARPEVLLALPGEVPALVDPTP